VKPEYLLCRHFVLPSLVLLPLLFTGCGNVGDPLPPLVQIPRPVSDLQALQVGNTVKLSWTIPEINTDGSSTPVLTGIEIYRLPSEGLSRTVSGEPVFPESVQPWRVLRENELETYKPGDKLTLIDPLVGIPLDTFSRTTLAYALKAFNKKGQDAGFSNIVLTQLFPAPKPPQNLRSFQNEKAIEILWEAPLTNLDESPVDSGVKFNVYRSEDPKASSSQRLNLAPLTGDSFKDETMELGKTYFYWVRSVAPPSAGGIESLDSNPVEVTNKDIYPPKPPSEVAAISNGEAISLVWSPNTEPDLAGYVVYRSGPEKKFEKFSDTLLTKTSLIDSSVVKGQIYFYRIKAIDQKGNASDFSEEVSEKVE
jgi:hypothetical protein